MGGMGEVLDESVEVGRKVAGADVWISQLRA